MVKVSDDFIEYIEPEDLDELKWNEGLHLKVKGEPYHYRIHRDDGLCFSDDDMQFLHYGDVVDVDYDDIEYMYKVKEPLSSDMWFVVFLVGFAVFLSLLFLIVSV